METMKPLLLATLALMCAAPTAQADDLIMLSAAAVRPALLQVPAMFERATGHRLMVSFGNATAIQNKVVAGEPVDVVVLPPTQISDLMDRGFLVAGSSADFGVVRLGIAARAGSDPRPVATADAFKQVLLSAPSFGMPDPADGSTSSLYLVKMLDQLGVAEEMRPKIQLFPDGTKALEALAKGEVALSVAPVTSIHTVSGVQLLGPLPEALQLKTVYAAALPRRSTSPAAASALLKLLRSPDLAALLREKGIDPP
jgi:molybdate transport system substrate-binding protein